MYTSWKLSMIRRILNLFLSCRLLIFSLAICLMIKVDKKKENTSENTEKLEQNSQPCSTLHYLHTKLSLFGETDGASTRLDISPSRFRNRAGPLIGSAGGGVRQPQPQLAST